MADLKISQFTNGGTVQVTDEIATNRAGVNTKVTVGSAATKNAGTAIGNVPIIADVGGSPGLPPLDGSQLTNTVFASDPYLYDSSTTMGDPTSGNLRFNNATLASITAIAISHNTNASNAPDIGDFIATWDDSSSTIKGTLTIRKPNGAFVTFQITGLAANSGWTQLNGTVADSSGSFTDGDATLVNYSRTGDKGDAGAGTGDVTAASNIANNAVVLGDGGAKGIKAGTGTGYVKVVSGIYQTPAASIPLSDLAAQAASSVVMNATNGSAAPTAVTLAASQLLGRGATGNGGAITLGTNLSMSGTTLNASGGGSVANSGQYTIGTSIITWAHGLSGAPDIAYAILDCVTANVGYANGDSVFTWFVDDNGTNQGNSIQFDATNCYLIPTAGYLVANKSSPGSAVAIANGSWRVRMRAIKF